MTLRGCFATHYARTGDNAPHHRPRGAVACGSRLLLMCALLMASSHSEGPPYMPNADVKQYGVESCLIMNLYKPKDTADHGTGTGTGKGALRPVLVWIFGGDNTASEIIPYNATKLAGQNNAVVITVSYRLGVFGFAGFEADTQGTANWGMHDVIAAIEFVVREHVALHVDTSKIIVLGESSGATDSQILSMSPATKGLISGSISESGGLYAQDLKEAIHSTRKIGQAVGCDGGAAEPVIQKTTATVQLPERGSRERRGYERSRCAPASVLARHAARFAYAYADAGFMVLLMTWCIKFKGSRLACRSGLQLPLPRSLVTTIGAQPSTPSSSSMSRESFWRRESSTPA